MKCNDCGKSDYKPSSRGDVCENCFSLRGQLMTAMHDQRVDMDEFKQIQRVLSGNTHQGANVIRRVLGLTAPEI